MASQAAAADRRFSEILKGGTRRAGSLESDIAKHPQKATSLLLKGTGTGSVVTGVSSISNWPVCLG